MLFRSLSYEKVHSLIGKVIPVETIKSIVTSLEMKITNETQEGLTLAVPPYRVDVQRDCDVIEDILRIYGYNNVEIPTTLKSSLTTKGEHDKSNKLQNLVAEQLVGCGFNEILNNSLTRAAYYDGLETYPSNRLVMLLNPLSADLNPRSSSYELPAFSQTKLLTQNKKSLRFLRSSHASVKEADYFALSSGSQGRTSRCVLP